jgi:hypothetical protein
MAQCALEASAFALDDPKQPGGIGLDRAEVADLARDEHQAFLNRVLDVIDRAVVLGVAAQVVARAREQVLQRSGVPSACGFDFLVGGSAGHRRPRAMQDHQHWRRRPAQNWCLQIT